MHVNNSNYYSNYGKTVEQMKQIWECNNHINQLGEVIGKSHDQIDF